MGSKSQHEVFAAQIDSEREEVRDRPAEAEAEVGFMFEREGLDPGRARRVAAEIATDKEVLLRTMVEKELGIAAEPNEQALRGALILSGSLAIAALIPLAPYFFFGIHTALLVSVIASGVALFVLGVVKSRFTRRNPLRAGLEILALGAVAGIGGYFVGTILPELIAGVKPTV